MSLLATAFTASGTICLTPALVYAFVWLQRREARAYLLFSLAALGASGSAPTELMLMRRNAGD